MTAIDPRTAEFTKPLRSRHEAAWQKWVHEKAKPWCNAKRGRYAALARHLEVSRQTVSRWFRFTPMPGWAAVAINIYMNRAWAAEQKAAAEAVTSQADKVESRFKHLEFVTGSEDKRRVVPVARVPVGGDNSRVVTPDLDKLVTPQADELPVQRVGVAA